MYLLMNKDKEIARFHITSGDFGDTYTFACSDKEQLPIGFAYIEKWLNNRKGSKHNAHLQQIMKDCGCDRTEGFIKVTHAASINDTFWVKSEQESITWKDVSFYRNEFDQTISKLAFEGIGLYGIQLSSTSPELSTEGSFRKCWRRENGDIFLYKRGSSGARNAGLEPYCEKLGADFAKALSNRTVEYEITKLHKELASKYLLFTNEEFGYVPISRFSLNHDSPNELMKFYEKLGDEDLFRRMIVIDSICFNVDRHAGNYGVLVHNDTQKPICMAPIFDMNLSMLPYAEKEEFEDVGRKLMDYGPRIGDDFTRMGQQALTTAIRSDLVGLKGFQFQFRGNDQFPEWRVKIMEELVNKQIEAVLSKEILRTQDVFVPKKEIIEKTAELAAQKSPEEERAEQLGGNIIKSGYVTEYSIESVNDHFELVLFPNSKEYAEIRLNMSTMDMWLEVNVEPVSRFTMITKYPELSDVFDHIESMAFESQKEIQEHSEEIER